MEENSTRPEYNCTNCPSGTYIDFQGATLCKPCVGKRVYLRNYTGNTACLGKTVCDSKNYWETGTFECILTHKHIEVLNTLCIINLCLQVIMLVNNCFSSQKEPGGCCVIIMTFITFCLLIHINVYNRKMSDAHFYTLVGVFSLFLVIILMICNGCQGKREDPIESKNIEVVIVGENLSEEDLSDED